MLRRSFLVLLSGTALLPRQARAAEAAPLAAGFGDLGRSRLESQLSREGFALTGEARRKGDFIIVTASKSNAPWRLVLDGRTGEIIGQRPLGGAIPVSD
jgi:hypothetical protein